MNDKLLPCPFCGGKGLFYKQAKGWLVKCQDCGASKNVFTRYITQALAEWNARVNAS